MLFAGRWDTVRGVLGAVLGGGGDALPLLRRPLLGSLAAGDRPREVADRQGDGGAQARCGCSTCTSPGYPNLYLGSTRQDRLRLCINPPVIRLKSTMLATWQRDIVYIPVTSGTNRIRTRGVYRIRNCHTTSPPPPPLARHINARFQEGSKR